MQKLIMKSFTPILYVGFVITNLWVVFFALVFADIVLLGGAGASLVQLASIIFVSLVFLFANKVLVALEKLVRPTVGDHFRQSAILYVIILAAFFKTVFFNEYHLGLNIWPVWVMMFLSVMAILINAFYLFWFSRRPLTTHPSLATPAVIKSPFTKIGMSIFIGPALILLLMVAGYYARQMHYRIEYLRMNPPPRVASPNDPPPPADLQSLSGKMSSSMTIDISGLPSPSPDLNKLRW